MRRVAEKIEYSPTTIYLHFADKEELFRELWFRQLDLAPFDLFIWLHPLW